MSHQALGDEVGVKHILAVDDSADNLLLIEALLEDIQEYRLSLVTNGAEALQLIDLDPPDLILLDIMMPEMDGYEVTRLIRSNQKLAFIPILLLTAHHQSEVATGLDLGADDFIRKPFQVNELMARIRALLRLKCSIDEQNKIMRQRDDFVARLTHDLRTPIIATNRILEFCCRGTYGQQLESLEPYLTGVIDNNKQLLHMVNSLLEVHRHEANRKQLTLVSIDLPDLLESVVRQLSPLATEKNLNLSLHQTDNLSDCNHILVGDRIEIHRVFTNLVGNAIKFTHTGGVEILIDYGPASLFPHGPLESQASHIFAVKVIDTGVGISPEALPTIFDQFRPGKHVNSGSGLGLNLSKRIVEMHQGKILLNSELHQSTTVEVLLPAVSKTR